MTARHGWPGVVAPPAAMVAMALAFGAWRGFSSDPSHIMAPAMVGVVALATSGVTLRSLAMPRTAVVATQFVLALLLGVVLISDGPPTPGSLETVVERLADSLQATTASPPPVSAVGGGVGPLMVVIVLAALWASDALASSPRTAPTVGIVMLAVYSIPTTLLDQRTTLWWGAASALGFLVLIALTERVEIDAWGREHRAAPRSVRVPFAGPAIAIGAVSGALLLALLVPVLDLGLLDDVGTDADSGDVVVITEPAANLQGDLQRGDDVPLLTVSTDDPDAEPPSYVQIGVLPTYVSDDQEWVSGELPQRPIGDGLQMPEGVTSDDPRVTWSFEATSEFRSSWLPVLGPVTSLRADDQWRYRREAGDFTRERGSTAGQSWTVASVPSQVTVEDLQAADGTDDVDPVYTQLGTVSQEVTDLATTVVENADATTDYDRAVALQRFLRDGDEFTYDLEASAEGDDTLSEFLFETRTGYCQHFASAMAVMARDLGIPSRVVVGFLDGRATGSGTWEFSAHGLHSWPELYFEGAGWVRFEPTPQRAASVPEYTRDQTESTPEPTPETSPSQTPTQPTPSLPDETVTPEQTPPDETDANDGAPLRLLAVVGSALLVLAALAGAPAMIRSARRRRHCAEGAEGAWEELRHSCRDHGLGWVSARSPRATAQAFVEEWSAGPTALAEDAVRDLDTLVRAVERERYAPSGTPLDLREGLVAELVAARVASRPRWRRALAALVPRSVFTERGRRGGRDDAAEDRAPGVSGERAVRVDSDDDPMRTPAGDHRVESD